MKHETHQFCPYHAPFLDYSDQGEAFAQDTHGSQDVNPNSIFALADAEERAYRERLEVADRLAQAEVEELLTEAERDEVEGHDEPRAWDYGGEG